MNNAKTRGAQAILARQEAERYRKLKPVRGQVDIILNEFEAEREEAKAAELLKPSGELITGCGEAVHLDPAAETKPWWTNTLKDPTMVGIDASGKRLEAAERAGVLECAVDAAESAGADDSLQKMLTHQMAAAHHIAMDYIARARSAEPFDMMRYTNAAARIMDTFRGGLLALHRVHTGGKQTVVVQHVEVSDGGQAVVAGTPKAKRPGGKRRRG